MSESLTSVPSEILTDAEAKILQSLADGNTIETTAKNMGLATTTIHYHITRIRTKLGCGNTLHVVVTAVRRELID
jgi:DNA-binding CsgD family transcriptional regulator